MRVFCIFILAPLAKIVRESHVLTKELAMSDKTEKPGTRPLDRPRERTSEDVALDTSLRVKVHAALADPTPSIPHAAIVADLACLPR